MVSLLFWCLGAIPHSLRLWGTSVCWLFIFWFSEVQTARIQIQIQKRRKGNNSWLSVKPRSRYGTESPFWSVRESDVINLPDRISVFPSFSLFERIFITVLAIFTLKSMLDLSYWDRWILFLLEIRGLIWRVHETCFGKNSFWRSVVVDDV